MSICLSSKAYTSHGHFQLTPPTTLAPAPHPSVRSNSVGSSRGPSGHGTYRHNLQHDRHSKRERMRHHIPHHQYQTQNHKSEANEANEGSFPRLWVSLRASALVGIRLHFDMIDDVTYRPIVHGGYSYMPISRCAQRQVHLGASTPGPSDQSEYRLV